MVDFCLPVITILYPNYYRRRCVQPVCRARAIAKIALLLFTFFLQCVWTEIITVTVIISGVDDPHLVATVLFT